jgi:hypothetical protein
MCRFSSQILIKMINWTLVSEKKPTCWQTGDWDGNRSDLCVCQDEKGEYHLAHLYEYYDGQFEWYDKDDYGLRHEVVKWAYVSAT